MTHTYVLLLHTFGPCLASSTGAFSVGRSFPQLPVAQDSSTLIVCNMCPYTVFSKDRRMHALNGGSFKLDVLEQAGSWIRNGCNHSNGCVAKATLRGFPTCREITSNPHHPRVLTLICWAFPATARSQATTGLDCLGYLLSPSDSCCCTAVQKQQFLHKSFSPLPFRLPCPLHAQSPRQTKDKQVFMFPKAGPLGG